MHERLSAVLNVDPVRYALVDAAGLVLAANETMAVGLGYTVDEMIGQPAWRLTPHLSERGWGQICEEVDQLGCFEVETLGPRGGGLGPFRFRVDPARDAGEGRQYLLRCQPLPPSPENRLPSAEHWLRCLTSFGRDAFWAWEQGSATVVLHPRWCEMAGIEQRASAPFEWLARRFHPDDQGLMRAQMAQMARGGVERAELRLRLLHGDRAYRWIHHRAYVAAYGPDGKPSWLMGHDIDITAQVEAEAEAVARERELRSLLDRVGTAVIVFDRTGSPTRWNSAAARMLGVAYDGLPAVIAEFDAGAEWDPIDESGRSVALGDLPVRTSMRTGEPVFGQVLGLVVRGRRRWGSFTAVPSLDPDGQVIDVVYTVTEITEARRLQEELARRQSLARVGRLAGGVAHHFNNLLTVIAMSAELIEHSSEADPRLAVEVADLRAAVHRGAVLIRQLLSYAARQDRLPGRVDVGALIEGSHAMAAGLLPGGVRFEVAVEPGLRPVPCDADQVEQVVVNLLANAGEALAGRSGSVELAARGARRPDGRAFVVLSVRDDGPGMSAEVAAQVVEPFFTTKASAEACGLGLSACQGIATQNGGELRIESREGEGTVVEVWLPVVAGGDAGLG